MTPGLQQPAGEHRVERDAVAARGRRAKSLELRLRVVHDLGSVAGEPRLERDVVGAARRPRHAHVSVSVAMPNPVTAAVGRRDAKPECDRVLRD